MPLGAEQWLILAAVAAAAAACCGGVSLPLERAFPANERVKMEVLRARDRARHSRILQGLDAVVDFNVAGSSDPYLIGLYFTKVKLGSPPREFNVQIDTGSDVLWVTCSSCTDCPQLSGLGIELNSFDVGSSATASTVSCSDQVCASIVRSSGVGCETQSSQCGYSFQYGDGSGTSGFYVNDLLYFDTVIGASMFANSSAPVVFGCSTYQSGDLIKPDRAIDGIFGFGQQELSVISQLSSRGITPKVFSHCLKGEGNGGGILVLGEILDPNIVYSPLVPSQPHYNLHLQSIAVNGELLPIDPAVFSTSVNRGTIVDSGTTLAYLVEDAYEPFVNAITAISQPATPINSNGYPCYLAATSVTETFPLVALNFAGGASMVLRPEDYLMHYGFVDDAPMWCIGFQKVQGQGITILGDLVLKDKIFVYDLSRQRLGWANYDCSSSVNVSITSGYFSNSEATASTLDSNGWLRTGDLCYIDDDGYVFVVDRLKELIKYKGYQVPPAELEALLLTHPQIVDAAVIPYPDKEAGQFPMAYVVRKTGSNLSDKAVMEFVAKQVAPYKKVRRVAFVDSIPNNPSGKILRKDLIKLATSRL